MVARYDRGMQSSRPLDGRYEPLNIDARLLIVRTDDGYEPCYEEVCAFVAAGAAA